MRKASRVTFEIASLEFSIYSKNVKVNTMVFLSDSLELIFGLLYYFFFPKKEPLSNGETGDSYCYHPKT